MSEPNADRCAYGALPSEHEDGACPCFPGVVLGPGEEFVPPNAPEATLQEPTLEERIFLKLWNAAANNGWDMDYEGTGPELAEYAGLAAKEAADALDRLQQTVYRFEEDCANHGTREAAPDPASELANCDHGPRSVCNDCIEAKRVPPNATEAPTLRERLLKLDRDLESAGQDFGVGDVSVRAISREAADALDRLQQTVYRFEEDCANHGTREAEQQREIERARAQRDAVLRYCDRLESTNKPTLHSDNVAITLRSILEGDNA